MKLKITGGLFKGRFIDPPKGSATRPTSEKLRKTYFDICQDKVEEATVIDFFAGSGAIGIEAISRGALHAYFIDQDHHATNTIKLNLESLHIQEKATVYKMDIFKALKLLEDGSIKADIIFIDPPYAKESGSISLGEKLLGLLDQSEILKENTWIFLEEGRYFNSERAFKDLKKISLFSSRGSQDTMLYLLKVK